MFSLFFLSLLPPLALADIITLKKEENIICVATESTVNSPVYVNPPIQSKFNETSNDSEEWIQDDWNITSSASLFSPITDKRWQDLKTLTESNGFGLQQTTSLSIYTTGNITFTIFSYDFSENTTFDFTPKDENPSLISSTCRWFHYSILSGNNTLKILLGDQIIETYQTIFTPSWVYMNTPCSDGPFWKVHTYQFRYSDTTTKNENEKSYKNITFADNLCLSMYVSIDKESYLEVSLESGTQTNTMRVLGFNQEHELKKWKRIEIKANSPGSGKLSFFRGHKEDEDHGYWAIDDIEFCHQNLDVYHARSSAPMIKYQTCEILDGLSTTDFTSIRKPGFLGNITCSQVLGTSYPYCENHTICLSGICFCSWGYQGDSCDEACETGTWGLFCEKQCPFNCKKCHLATGDCLEERNNSKLTDKEFPVNITLSSGQIYVELPPYEDIDGELTYNFKYFCMNESCQEKVIYETNYTISSLMEYSPLIVEDVDDVGEYRARVTMKRSNDTLVKDYYVVQVQQELDNVTETLSNFTLKELSDEEFVLSWDASDIDGSLQYFELKVQDYLTIHSYIIPINKDNMYEQKVALTAGATHYSCSIRTVKIDLEETISLEVYIGPSPSKWNLPQPLVEICFDTCQLAMPKPGDCYYSDFYVLVTHNFNEEENVIKIFESRNRSVQYGEYWILPKSKECQNFIYFDIDQELAGKVNTYPEDYSIHLISAANDKYVLYSSRSLFLPIFIVFLLISLPVFLYVVYKNALHILRSNSNIKYRSMSS